MLLYRKIRLKSMRQKSLFLCLTISSYFTFIANRRNGLLNHSKAFLDFLFCCKTYKNLQSVTSSKKTVILPPQIVGIQTVLLETETFRTRLRPLGL
jgi:hypothetical protein